MSPNLRLCSKFTIPPDVAVSLSYLCNYSAALTLEHEPRLVPVSRLLSRRLLPFSFHSWCSKNNQTLRSRLWFSAGSVTISSIEPRIDHIPVTTPRRTNNSFGSQFFISFPSYDSQTIWFPRYSTFVRTLAGSRNLEIRIQVCWNSTRVALRVSRVNKRVNEQRFSLKSACCVERANARDQVGD